MSGIMRHWRMLTSSQHRYPTDDLQLLRGRSGRDHRLRGKRPPFPASAVPMDRLRCLCVMYLRDSRRAARCELVESRSAASLRGHKHATAPLSRAPEQSLSWRLSLDARYPTIAGFFVGAHSLFSPRCCQRQSGYFFENLVWDDAETRITIPVGLRDWEVYGTGTASRGRFVRIRRVLHVAAHRSRERRLFHRRSPYTEGFHAAFLY